MGIHAIYIYFIINAFIAGKYHDDIDSWKYSIVWFLFGSIMFLFVFIQTCFEWLYNKSLIGAFYKLYFTNYYADMHETYIKLRKQQYDGIRLDSNMNAYERFFWRKVDKKYKYGITTEKPIY